MKTSTGIGINSGAMRERVVIQSRSTTLDSSGEQLNTWTLFSTRRAEVVRTYGREIFASAARQARVPTLFRLRKLEGVLPGMRLLCRGKLYDIISAIDPTGRDEELLITTEEIVGETP